MINPHTPLWQLTVGEFLELQKKYNSIQKYEYGIKGLAKILGCSRSKAQELKQSGIFDKAIYQNGKTIIVDRDKVLALLNETK
ncbi:DUF3853 family protein [Ornithobacterium rhinotracheale]|uniref:DUF3853 family protein n=1 Tax=Ornithobacterium rhinotracheale TaxID=28251 RepID=UPI00129C7D56|nr:DUF3853 family protein [Ornithobacterium rhinotracheale]MRJ11378.1 DUF3853 family protein [Ornithobacterium rhinotracheale]